MVLASADWSRIVQCLHEVKVNRTGRPPPGQPCHPPTSFGSSTFSAQPLNWTYSGSEFGNCVWPLLSAAYETACFEMCNLYPRLHNNSLFTRLGPRWTWSGPGHLPLMSDTGEHWSMHHVTPQHITREDVFFEKNRKIMHTLKAIFSCDSISRCTLCIVCWAGNHRWILFVLCLNMQTFVFFEFYDYFFKKKTLEKRLCKITKV